MPPALNTLLLVGTALGAAGIDHYLSHQRARSASSQERPLLSAATAAWHESTIYPHVSGTIGRWLADIGDQVQAGQLLCVIDAPELDAQLAAARAQLQASRAQLLLQHSALEFARLTYERWRDSPEGVVSEQEREAKRADFTNASARFKAAEAQLAIDQAQINRDLELSRSKEVLAPLDGIIAARNIDIGSSVFAAGTSAPTALYRLVQDDPIRVFARAPQSIAVDLARPGATAQVFIGSGSGARAYPGTVTRTAAAFDQRSHTLQIEIDVPNPRHELISGMDATVALSPAATLVMAQR